MNSIKKHLYFLLLFLWPVLTYSQASLTENIGVPTKFTITHKDTLARIVSFHPKHSFSKVYTALPKPLKKSAEKAAINYLSRSSLGNTLSETALLALDTTFFLDYGIYLEDSKNTLLLRYNFFEKGKYQTVILSIPEKSQPVDISHNQEIDFALFISLFSSDAILKVYNSKKFEGHEEVDKIIRRCTPVIPGQKTNFQCLIAGLKTLPAQAIEAIKDYSVKLRGRLLDQIRTQ